MRFENQARGEYVEVVWGRSRQGELGQSRPAPFLDLDAEEPFVEALEQQGFVAVGRAAVWDFAPNLELEAALRRDLDDVGAWSAYAAWLEVHGEPSLAALLRDSEPTRDNPFSYQWFGDLHEWCRELGDWRGLPRELQCVSDRPLDELRQVLDWPLCRFLERVDLCFDDHEATVPVLEAWSGLRRLRSLALWTEEDHGCDLPDLSRLWPLAGELRSLSVVGGSDDSCLGVLALPQLEQLARRSQRLSTGDLQSIIDGRWPRLEALTIGAGRRSTITATELAALLSTERFPALRRLAIEQCPCADELVQLLVRSPLLSQLTHLSLSQSLLTGVGASSIAAQAPAFAHLEAFDIRETALTEEEGQQLFRALPLVGEHNAFVPEGEALYELKNYQTRFWEAHDAGEKLERWKARLASPRGLR